MPAISTNLLSVHKFTKDNNCCFIFDSSGYSVQDQLLGKILFQGLSENGLYPFSGSASPSNRGSSPIALVGAKVTDNVWHKRLGHPSSLIFRLWFLISVYLSRVRLLNFHFVNIVAMENVAPSIYFI